MAKPFDPYYRWLGIPPAEQPANHYRLLGVAVFEPAPDVIEAAADQRMAHLRNYQSGKHSALSQKLLNEVAAARVCLLNPQKKVEYDRGLREKLEAKRRVIPQAEPLEPGEPEKPVDSGLARLFEKTGGGEADIARSQHARDRRQVKIAAGAAVVVVGLIALVGLIVLATRSSSETMLSLDWPEHERRAGSLRIDGRREDLYATGPLEYSLEPGEHRVTAARPGYQRYAEKFTLVEGKRVVLRPEWRKLPPEPVKETPKPAASNVEPKVPETKAVPKPAEVERPKVAETVGPAKPQAATAPKPARLPVPPEEERVNVARQLRELFELDKDRRPAERRALAKEMVALAEKSAKPAERYVLLHTAAELTCGAGGAVEMLGILDKLAAAFEVDALAEKAVMLRTVAAGAKDSAGIAALLAAGDKVIDEALSHQKYDLALELAEEAYKACAQSAGREHRKRAFDRRKQVQALAASFQGLQSVLEKLKTDPDDPEANLAAGRHYCFDRGNWDKGLLHLAKSSDADLKKLAQEELQSPPTDPAAMIKLADAWWSLSEARKDAERDALMLRAGTWYREAQPDATSTLLKAKLDKRLDEIAKLKRPIPEPSFQGPPTPAIAPFSSAQAKRHQQRWAKHLGVPVETTNSIGMKLVLIPPGEFDMGSSQEEIDQLRRQVAEGVHPSYMERILTEAPRHHVRITKPFYLGSYELRVGQFRKFVDATGYKTDGEKDGKGGWGPDPATGTWGKRPDCTWQNPGFSQSDEHPVVNVSWNDAVALCRWLAEKERKPYRLPREAEWEYACRAGTTTRFFFGDEAGELGQYAWYDKNSGRTAHPVGQKRPNPWGLFDIHGNACEWCEDWRGSKYYATSPAEDPTGPDSGWARVIRDGSYNGTRDYPRPAHRYAEKPDGRNVLIGLRVACELPASQAGAMSLTPGPAKAEHSAVRDPSGEDAEPPSQGPLRAAVAPFGEAQAKRHQQRWAKHLGVPVETTNSIGMKLVLIPPGEFEMGSSQEEIDRLLAEAKERNLPEWYLNRVRTEGPQHRVRITKTFYVGCHEVTVGQFRQFVKATQFQTEAEKDGEGGYDYDAAGKWTQKPEHTWRNPRLAPTDQHPVSTLTWNDAKAFCEWLSEKDKRTYRLPTEAEWEYACRAGTATRRFFGDDEAALERYAWFRDNSGKTLHAVGEKKPNPWGIHDLFGNVAEWCHDKHGRSYYDDSPTDDPSGPSAGSQRSLRGYAWDNPAPFCRSGLRDGCYPSDTSSRFGFRVVCELAARQPGGPP